MNPRAWLAKYWWTGLIVAPAILLIYLVLHYAGHAPFWDQWELVEVFREHQAGTLSWADFWAQHNEHRILLPRLIMFGLGLVTSWDPYYETWVNIGLAFAILAVLIKVIKRHSAPKDFAIFSTMAAWLVLSPVQSENWLWGWQIQWYLSVLGVVLAIWGLTAKQLSLKWFLLAVLGGLIATFSLANGFTIWPIGLGLLLLRAAPNRYRLGWGLIGLAGSVAYYINYVNPAYHPSKTAFIHQPVEFFGYISVYLGRPLATSIKLAAVAGVVTTGIFVISAGYLWLKQRQTFNGLLPWLGLAAYAGLSAVLTAVSRLGLGAGQSFASRYTTISVLFTLATVIFAVAALRAVKLRQQLANLATGGLLLIVGLLTLINYGKGIEQMRQQHTHLLKVESCLVTAKSAEDPCLLQAYPNGPVAWQRLQFLRAEGLGGFNR